MALKPGVYTTKCKDGSISYRASITYKNKHISLGSYPSEDAAHSAYCEAQELLSCKESEFNKLPATGWLTFSKRVVLYNFKINEYYFKTPILLKDTYFLYFLSPELILKFDVDDLFFYSTHTITKRGGHLFVSDYGMQINILSRYGIKNFAVEGRDYRFINGDTTDFRYKNIEIINKYYGVQRKTNNGIPTYEAYIHINGNYKIGTYRTEIEAAIAYNKAVNLVLEKGINKNYMTNYILEVDEIGYASIYHKVRISKKIRDL